MLNSVGYTLFSITAYWGRHFSGGGQQNVSFPFSQFLLFSFFLQNIWKSPSGPAQILKLGPLESNMVEIIAFPEETGEEDIG